MVYGSNIDNAATENGKPYSELPNAFRYRNEIVAGCTCNGKDPIGLAQVKIEDDPTLRKGDIVAGDNGLVVASRSADKRGASLNFSPASERSARRYGACRWWRRSDVDASCPAKARSALRAGMSRVTSFAASEVVDVPGLARA